MSYSIQSKIVPLIFFLGLLSCDLGNKTFSKYELINESDHQIIIKSFSRENQNLQKKIGILDMNEKWESLEFQTSEPGGQVLSPEDFLEGDSIRIEFDDNKVLVYIGIFEPRNILYEENYELLMIDDTHTVRKYTFTEDDYRNAEEI